MVKSYRERVHGLFRRQNCNHHQDNGDFGAAKPEGNRAFELRRRQSGETRFGGIGDNNHLDVGNASHYGDVFD